MVTCGLTTPDHSSGFSRGFRGRGGPVVDLAGAQAVGRVSDSPGRAVAHCRIVSMLPLTGLPRVVTDAVHDLDAAEHVQRVATLVGARAFGLVTPARADYVVEANRWLVRHAASMLWTRGVEVHEIAVSITLTDYREGRWLRTAGPCLLLPAEVARDLRVAVRRIADRFGHGHMVFHSALGGLEAARRSDGVLIGATGVVAEDPSRSPRFELVATSQATATR